VQNCWTAHIAKVDEDKRLVTAWYSQVSDQDGQPIVDRQGDIIPIQELEAADIEAFAEGGLRKGGEMHATVGGADIVQHFTLSQSERAALGFGQGPEGGIVKLHVTDETLWQRIKRGDYPDLSIAGDAVREAA
jgi:hypothetical protein